MRLVTVSVLSMMVCGAAFGNARLPVVNIGAGAVSARAAFGESVPTTASAENTIAKQESESTRTVRARPTTSRATVARAATMTAPEVKVPLAPVDTGVQIAQNQGGDILTPRRPSGDLWARADVSDTSDVALRMPRPDEFSVIRSDAPLPEESLDTPVRVAANRTPVAPVVEKVAPATPAVAVRNGALDAEIAKLVDARRRMEDENHVTSRAAVRPVVATNTGAVSPRPMMARGAGVRSAGVPQKQEQASVAPVMDAPVLAATPVAPVPAAENTAPSVRRMVVPMEPDVVVRSATPAHTIAPMIAAAETDMASMSPSELKKAFKKTYLSENKHLSTFQIDNRFDVASDMDTGVEGFTTARDLSESGGIRPLEIKIKFRGDDASLSRENYNLLTEYASIVLANPKRAVQVSIPEVATHTSDARKLAARRLAIVEQVLRDMGVSEHRIMPVLAARDDQGFVLRMISNDQFETLTQQKRDMFGDTVGKKTYKSMTW